MHVIVDNLRMYVVKLFYIYTFNHVIIFFDKQLVFEKCDREIE